MRTLISRIVQDESGATAVEYGLMVALIAVTILLVVRAVGLSILGVFTTVDNTLQGL